MPEPTRHSPAAEEESSSAEGGFDQLLARLRQVVERLEAGSLGLEQSLAAFEEGVKLSRRGAEILDRAEQRVEVLTRTADGGQRVAPLALAPGEGADGGHGEGGDGPA